MYESNIFYLLDMISELLMLVYHLHSCLYLVVGILYHFQQRYQNSSRDPQLYPKSALEEFYGVLGQKCINDHQLDLELGDIGLKHQTF